MTNTLKTVVSFKTYILGIQFDSLATNVLGFHWYHKTT